MTPDEMQARLDAIATAPGQTGFGPTVQAILATVQQVYNLVGTEGTNLAAAKTELDVVKTELDAVKASGVAVDLSAVTARLDALGKHLGVGTP